MPEEKQDAPAYVAWKTFMTATGQLEGAVPPQLDTSVFPSHAGSVKSQLLSTFRFLGLTETDGRATESLHTWVEDPAGRPGLMGGVLRQKYPAVLALADQNATPRQMHAEFAKMGVSGSTLRKAVTFFIKACELAEIEVPSSWKRTGSVVASPTKGETPRRAKRKAQVGPERGDSTARDTGPTDGDSVTLRSGGTVTLSVNQSMLHLTSEDRRWLFELIDHFRSYPSSDEGDEADED